MPYVKKFKATINPTTDDLRETVNDPKALMLIEELTLQILDLIVKKSLNTRQVNALLECIQVEIKEFTLS